MNEPAAGAGAPAEGPASAALTRHFEIVNKKGLHARASARFVQTVERFDAQVTVTRSGESVGGTSIMGLMMLSAGPGTMVEVAASGPQAAEVIAALEELIAGKFGEEE